MSQAGFDTQAKRPVGNCVVCGKETPVRDIRDVRAGNPVYCGRVHQALARFGTRYRGSGSGPMDRPSTNELMQKTKWKSV